MLGRESQLMNNGLNVLLCKWRGCIENSLKNNLTSLGYTVDEVEYDFSKADYSVECANILREKFDISSYAFVISQNFIPIVSKVSKIYKTIYISWVMDSPAYHLYSNSIKSPYNRIFIFDKSLYEKVVVENPQCIFYYPLATDVDYWDSIPCEDTSWLCDVSFLGSMYNEVSKYNEIDNMPDYLRGYMDGLINSQLNVYGYNFLEDALDYNKAVEFRKYADWNTAEDYRDEILSVVADVYLGQKCAEIERYRVVNILSDMCDFNLYTNSDTSKYPNINNMGTVGYYDEMPNIFRRSKINLNITSKSIRTGVPLRVFDIMGAGGFLISNYQSEISEYFEVDKEIVLYDSMSDLVNKVSYYLDHEEERIEIAHNGYMKVKECFSIKGSLKDIISMAR